MAGHLQSANWSSLWLTPPSENDTTAYLAELKRAGVDVDKDVKSQIDKLMVGVEANEGLITGTEIQRIP